jgi:choline monooxygenase
MNELAGKTEADGLRTARALDPKYYFGDDMHELERQWVFGRSWQWVAHRAELADAGDHVLTDVAGTPTVILRGADSVLRAFPNVCRHRAGPLVLCSGKGLGNLRCKYHGWLYNQSGQLVAAPDMQDAVDFRTADVRLPSLRVREWEGLVFVALDEHAPAFDEVYAGIVDRVRPVELGAMQFVRHEHWEVACNWKVYVDNFLEGYHVPMVHPALAQAVDYANYDVDLYPWYSLQHSPLRGSDAIYGEGEALYYFVYPNVMLNVMPGRLQMNRVLPLGPGRCRVDFDWFYTPTPTAMARVDNDREFTNAIQEEDVAICEWVQKGLSSGNYVPGRLSPRREAGVWHFHRHLRAAYAAAGVAAG